MDTGHNCPLTTGRGKAGVIARWSCQCQPGFATTQHGEMDCRCRGAEQET